MATDGKPQVPALSWELDVPLATNPAILISLVKVWALAAVLMLALVGGIVALQDGIRVALPLARMLLLVSAGLFVASLLVMLAFGNRMRMAFLIDDRGVAVHMVDKRAKLANRLAVVAGALAGKPGAAGAGLMAIGDEDRSAVWDSIVDARYDPRHNTIALRNDWRTILHVFCTPDIYEQAAQRIAAQISSAVRPRQAARNPLWGALGLSIAAVLAILPLFAMPYPFETHLLAIMLMLFFALATIWLVPLLAWVVLACVGWIVLAIVLRGIEPKVNRFDGSAYTSFGVLDGDDIMGFSIAALGLGVLVWISVAALRGRIQSLWARDTERMAGND